MSAGTAGFGAIMAATPAFEGKWTPMSSAPPPRTADHVLDALLQQAQAAMGRGDPDAAEAACEAALAHEPACADARAYLAMRALDRDDAPRALQLADAGLGLDPAAARLAFYRGCALEALGREAEAIAAFHAAAADPELLAARFRAGALEHASRGTAVALRTWVPALAEAERRGWLGGLQRLAAEVRRPLEAAIAAVAQERALRLQDALAPLRAQAGAAALARIDAAVDMHLGRRAREWCHPLQRPSFLLVPGLSGRPWFEREDLPWLAAIEAQVDAIRAEALAVMREADDLRPYVDMPERAPAAAVWQELNRSPRWSAYHLWRDGEPVAAHVARCPRTAAALAALPSMRLPGHSPEALYSILAPGTHIPPHTGVINGRLTVHLPLVVPPDCGALACGGEARPWVEGRCLVFDDSIVHEARNRSAQARVVLIFDAWNPELSEVEREGLALVVGAIAGFNRECGVGVGQV